MVERLGGLFLSFLGGYAALWLGWTWRKRPWTRQQVARAFLGLAAAVLVALLVAQTITTTLWGMGCVECFVVPLPGRIAF